MMKHSRFSQLILAIIFMLPILVFAQPDQGLNFQAVARDNKGELLSSEKIDLIMTIQKAPSSKFGSPVKLYEEEHIDVLTDKYGVFSTVIGTGKVLSGNFTNLDWQAGNIQVEVACKFPGSSQFTSIGTVPLQINYKAYHAKVADIVTNQTLGGLTDVAISGIKTGDILSWDGSKWVSSTPVTTHKVYLGPTNIIPENSQTPLQRNMASVSVSSGSGALLVPLNLPVGSTITKLKAHFWDNSNNNIKFDIYRGQMKSSIAEYLGGYTSTLMAGVFQDQELSFFSNAYREVPENYFMGVRIYPATGSSWSVNLKIKAIEVEYELPQ